MDDKPDVDVLIVGGGPGGLSALHWCADLGMTAILFEKGPEFGGQLLYTYNPITNYLGVEARDGRELRDIFLRDLSDRGVERMRGVEVVATDLDRKLVTTANGAAHSGRSMILATGVRRRELGIPGERDFLGKGLLESGAKEKLAVAGKRVVIVGGGDAALENALMLAERAKKVTVVHRRAVFTARPDFVEPARGNERIEFITNSTAAAITGRETVEAVVLKNGGILEADAVLIRIGVAPNTELFQGQAAMDDAGYLLVDSCCSTSRPGVYAVGDVINRGTSTIAAAVGQGSIAVKAIRSRSE